MATISLPSLKQEIVVELEGTELNLKKIDSVIKKLDFLRERGEITGEEAAEGILKIREALDRVADETGDATKGFNNLNKSQKLASSSLQKAAVGTRQFGTAANNANQILFSFGDAVQDGAQFQFGFAQGARAVGNNLAFASEQIALTAQKTGSLSSAFKAIGGSLFGPAGVILAINAAITAITVLSNSFGRAEKEAKKLTDAAGDLSQDLFNLNEFNKLNSRSLLEQSNRLNQLAGNLERYSATVRDAKTRAILEEDAKKLRDQADILEARRQAVIANIVATTDLNEAQAKNLQSNIDLRDLRIEQLKIDEERLSLFVQQDGVAGILFGTLDDQLEVQRGIIRLERRNIEQKLESNQLTQEEADLQQRILDNRLLQLKIEADAKREAAREANELGIPASIAFIEEDTDKLTEQILNNEGQLQDSLTQLLKDGVTDRSREFERELEAYKKIQKEKVEFTGQSLRNILEVSSTIIRGLFGENKAAAIATAIIDGAAAVQKALASAPPPFNFGLAAAVAAATAKQISTIKNTEIDGGGGGGSSPQFRGGQYDRNTGGTSFVSSIVGERGGRSDQFPQFTIENKITNRGLYTAVKSGKREVLASSRSV